MRLSQQLQTKSRPTIANDDNMLAKKAKFISESNFIFVKNCSQRVNSGKCTIEKVLAGQCFQKIMLQATVSTANGQHQIRQNSTGSDGNSNTASTSSEKYQCLNVLRQKCFHLKGHHRLLHQILLTKMPFFKWNIF